MPAKVSWWRSGVAEEGEADPVREVEPLVTVDGDRVRPLEPDDERRRARTEAEEGAEGAVDVEPEPVLGAEIGDLGQRVCSAGVRRACVGDHDRGEDAVRTVARDRRLERDGVEAIVGVDLDAPHAVGTEPERAERLDVREVQLGRAVDREGRECAHAVAIHVDAEPAPDVVPCDGQRDEVRARGTAREDRTAAGKLEEVGEPAEHDLLELRGRRPERPEPRVLVDRGRPRVRDRSRGRTPPVT